MTFDSKNAKKFLIEQERKEEEAREKERETLLKQTIRILEEEFRNSSVEVYLVGSIIRPFHFSACSDIDIVLKNYTGDRFDLWTSLEKKIGRTVEIIYFESCPFQEFVLQNGLKVV